MKENNMKKNKTKYVAFNYTNVGVDFKYMGVKRDEFSYANGEDCLYVGGKIYGKDKRIKDNELILCAYGIPKSFIEGAKDTDELINILHERGHDHLMEHYGFFSENYDLELLTKEDINKILTDQKYKRTVGTFFDEHRNEMEDKIYELNKKLTYVSTYRNNDTKGFYELQKSIINDLVKTTNSLDAKLNKRYEQQLYKENYKMKESA
jgi:hypothetical protein